MDISSFPYWNHVFAFGLGAMCGGIYIVARVYPRWGRSRVEENRLRRELAEQRQRLELIEEAMRRIGDLATRGIEEPARDAHRLLHGRTDLHAGVLRSIEDLDRSLGMGLTRTPGAPVPTLDFDTSARRIEGALEDLAQRMRVVGGEADGLTRNAETAATAVGAMTEVIGELERGGDSLAQASSETSESSAQMDDALRRMQASAGETSDISAKVAAEAERGYRAVHKTLDEIERIRDLSETARKRIDALGGRVIGIGDVVRVIQEIAEKTNLLALNASIIAAQAGEHGRSFAVVAQEIKALASKTAASTKQISEQIRAVQDESERAQEAMATGVTAVGEGFQVALGAGDALGEIRQSARLAQKKVQTMMRAMDEQGTASRRVVDAANLLAERAAGLSASVKEQSLHRGRLGESALTLADTAGRIARLAKEQLEGGRTIVDLVSRVATETASFTRGQKDVRRHLERLQSGCTQIGGAEGEVAERIAAMNEAAAQLREELLRLRMS